MARRRPAAADTSGNDDARLTAHDAEGREENGDASLSDDTLDNDTGDNDTGDSDTADDETLDDAPLAAGDLSDLDDAEYSRAAEDDVAGTAAVFLRQIGATDTVVGDDLALVRPRGGNEVLCASCFLIVRRDIVADPSGPFCPDCV